jgi:S-adenosylmethionine:tRNA ribosyltransferase-isomerase
MTDPHSISISAYSYHLPEEKIARHPLPERDAARLLLLKDGVLSEDIYRNIASHIPSGSLVIFNNTRVVQARLLFVKPTGGQIEIFCLGPHENYGSIHAALQKEKKVLWECLVGGASKWKRGQILEKAFDTPHTGGILYAQFIEKRSDCFIIELSWQPSHLHFSEVLHYCGAVPLPPYLKREAGADDKERYQTVYASEEGSVAAPTAGLHFTPQILHAFKEKNIETKEVTLHIGAGTFVPVKAEKMADHHMHAEWMSVERKTIEALLQHLQSNVIAVGTTSMRTLESLYWLGAKLRGNGQNSDELLINQWEPYQDIQELETVQALKGLLGYMDEKETDSITAQTSLLIAPGYKFRIVKGLVTNFHQPNSTLLLLVAAFVGERWKQLYEYALQHNFRFLSYGDGCLLWKLDNDTLPA